MATNQTTPRVAPPVVDLPGYEQDERPSKGQQVFNDYFGWLEQIAGMMLLTGKAVQQYNQLFALVRKQAPQQKQILTTTVTDSAVKSLASDRARLLIFADQRNTRTDKDQSSYSAAVFAVGAIRIDGKWKINNIDTLGA